MNILHHFCGKMLMFDVQLVHINLPHAIYKSKACISML